MLHISSPRLPSYWSKEDWGSFLHADFFSIINIYLHILIFLIAQLAQVFEIFTQERNRAVYPTINIMTADGLAKQKGARASAGMDK